MYTTKAEVLGRLRARAELAARAAPRARLYVFGSLLRAEEAWPADVDVLVVYELPADARRVREALAPLQGEMPLHVLFLSSSEEAQLRFVANEKCVPLETSGPREGE